MKSRARENFKVGLIVWVVVMACVYTPIFAWNSIKVIYTDHTGLVNRIKELKDKNSRLVDPKSRDEEIRKLQAEVNNLTRELGKSKKSGMGEQQLHIVLMYYPVGKGTVAFGDKTGRIIMLIAITNKTISPVDMILTCTEDFTPTDGPRLGIGGVYLTRFAKALNSRSAELTIGFPAWTPETPLGLPVFTEAKDMSCELKPK